MAKPKSPAEIKCEQLTAELAKVNDENAELKKRVEELTAKIAIYENPEGNSKSSAIEQARLTDSLVNGEGKVE